MKITKRLNLALSVLSTALANAGEWLTSSGKTHHFGARAGVKANLAVGTQGYKLEVSVDNGTTFVEVKQISAIVDPTGEASDLDASNLQSPGVKEYIAGLRDSSAVSITGQRVKTDAGQNLLRDNQGLVAKFRNTYVDGEILNYSATIKSFRITGNVDQVLMFSCAIRGSAAVYVT